MRVACIVEGSGEVAALPILLRRFPEWRGPEMYVDVQAPIRVKRDRFLQKQEEFSRYLLLASSKCGDGGWVLVLLDADDDCPAALGAETLARAKEIIPDRSVSVVLANREYEAWFIGAATSLEGKHGLELRAGDADCDAEVPRDAKGWLTERMNGRAYGPVADQSAFSAQMDLELAFARCRSFRKLCSEWDRHFHAD